MFYSNIEDIQNSLKIETGKFLWWILSALEKFSKQQQQQNREMMTSKLPIKVCFMRF